MSVSVVLRDWNQLGRVDNVVGLVEKEEDFKDDHCCRLNVSKAQGVDRNDNDDNMGKTLYCVWSWRDPEPEVWGAQSIREDRPAALLVGWLER